MPKRKIPKIIHQVWIGPKPAPLKWMDTWKKFNPDWEYVLWDNKKIFDKRRKWKNQWMIDEYVRRYEEDVKGKCNNSIDMFISAQGATFLGDKATYFAWHVIADIVRYEILYRYGGYMPGADSECVAPIGDYFDKSDLYIVNTGHLYTDIYEKLQKGRGDLTAKMHKLKLLRYAPENSAPIAACAKGHWFAKVLIDELSKLKKKDLGEAVDTTGNVLMGKMIRKHHPEAKVAYYLKNRDEFSATKKDGVGHQTGFSYHHSGTTRGCYDKGQYDTEGGLTEVNNNDKMDFVFLMGNSSTGRELKYSLRSLENINNVGKVVIVGWLPAFINEEKIIFIPTPGDSLKPRRDVIYKLLKVCSDDRLTKNIIVMNDDFFFLKPQEIRNYARPLLGNKQRENKKMLMTLGELEKRNKPYSSCLDYGIHYPMVINRDDFLRIFLKSNWKGGNLNWRTFYGNIALSGATKIDYDFKARTDDEFRRIFQGAFISSSDATERGKVMWELLDNKFPNKSKYELTK